ncbi:hypothetical protein GN958_ATG21997 [Phytophthora infestans]|uniref:Uncharacterized protein n=1 Tax=Phytophthora infestans TaxID=4787 RepID=A0A8S9TLE0_PHYIN|nr:hypothetical protein GN958_ATG21997 [Phytophthora infestans]
MGTLIRIQVAWIHLTVMVHSPWIRALQSSNIISQLSVISVVPRKFEIHCIPHPYTLDPVTPRQDHSLISEKALHHNRLLYVVGAAQQRPRRASPASTTAFPPSRHMSPAKRTGKSSGKVPSTTPPASPSSMSPTDLRVLAQALSDQVQTLTAELQTAQDAQAQAASLHTTQLQTLRAQIHDQAMEIQGWEHRAASRSQDLRLPLADQAVEIRDLTGRLDRASRQRDVMRDDNDHLLKEMALAGSEIHQLQSRIHDLERDLEDSQTARAAADVSLDRLRDVLRLTQEEVVTNDYVGSAHDGSALGSARGGPPAPNPPPSSPDVALAQLSEELQDTKESLERASAGRDYALEEFVRMTRLRNEIQAKLADSELQRDKATTEWADAERALTELESKLRRMSDKLKKADATNAKLQDQLSAAQTQQQQLILERDRGLSERDLARRRLALVTAAVPDPLPPLSGPSQAASVSAPLPTYISRP